MDIRKYRAKGSFEIVEAVQVNNTKAWNIFAEWCGGRRDMDEEYHVRMRDGSRPADRAYYLDYIVKGVDGKFFAVPPDDFVKKYRPQNGW